jgi:hypothetical protein
MPAEDQPPDLDLDDNDVDFRRWAPIMGRWERTKDSARYLPPPAGDDASGREVAAGILLAPEDLEVAAGWLSCDLRFPADAAEDEPQGRLVFGFHPRTQAHYSAGLGGWRALYVVEQFTPGEGLSPLRALGRPDGLDRDRDYDLTVYLAGQQARVEVDDVPVLELALPLPPEGMQVGLTAWGLAPVEFSNFLAGPQSRKAFIVMQFGEPYDTLYREVIAPACEDAGYEPIRADEFARPGIIINDIVQSIQEADVVIAEITPVNANVFYELGYSHAKGKPTILLADKGQMNGLPFDVSGWRCIFYDDTIGGKPRVDSELRHHLKAIA